MKHIVHVSNDFAPMSAGINTHLQNLLPELKNYGFKVTLLVPTASNGEDRGDIHIDNSWKNFTCVRVHYPENTNVISKLFSITKATKVGLRWIEERIGSFNLIHQHDNRATRIGATDYSRKNSIPVIWTNHSSGFFKTGDLTSRLLTYIPGIQPDGVVVVHRILQDRIQDFFAHCPVRYIPNGVNLKHFRPENISSKNEIIVFFPQRMIAQKGVKQLAKAAKFLSNNRSDVDLKFWFAGSAEGPNRDSKLIQDVKEFLAPEEKQGTVRFLGNPSYDDMPNLYSYADTVVLPLQVETENISVFEAWAANTPLITTEQVGKNGYMKNEENCLIIPNKDPQKLSEAIVRLTEDLELRKKLAANGRKLVEKKFTWTHAAEKTAAFYNEVLNSGTK